ncbi:hypothetical protein T484DRAFT_3631215 [Baffinella frigidus]|nr:hypothetical protein T484DRAFT_3631215 [Cryptophyta sp. CCMP2293]
MSGVPLSQSDVNSLRHHFTEKLSMRRTEVSQKAVDTAFSRLYAAKSHTIVNTMNEMRAIELDAPNVLQCQPSTLPDNPSEGVGSLATVTIHDNNWERDHALDKVYVKVAMPIPGDIHQTSKLFNAVTTALLRQSSAWAHANNLREAIYNDVFSAKSACPAGWVTSDDGMSVSKHTASGLTITCALLHTTLSDGQIHGKTESDQRFAQRVLCQGVIHSYSQQPMVFTARLKNDSTVLSATVYPCSKQAAGLLMGTLHTSGFARPLQSCGVIEAVTLNVHPQWGVHEADAATLMVPHVRRHADAVSSMFVKNGIMQAVLGASVPVFAVTDLCDLDEVLLAEQHAYLKSKLEPHQLQAAAGIWNYIRGISTTQKPATPAAPTAVAETAAVASEPAVEEPEPEPAVEEPEPEPAVEEPEQEPDVEEPEQEPNVEEPEQEPAVEEPEQEPVAEEPEQEPAVEEHAVKTKPHQHHVVPTPAVKAKPHQHHVVPTPAVKAKPHQHHVVPEPVVKSHQHHVVPHTAVTAMNAPALSLVCVAGTTDCFKQDSSHTSMVVHTRSMLEARFTHNGQDFTINSPLVVSMYGTYYHR